MRRFLFFILLLTLGITILYILSEGGIFSKTDSTEEDTTVPVDPSIKSAQMGAEGLKLLSYRSGTDKDGVAIRIPVSKFEAKKFAESGSGLYKLQDVIFSLFREDKPQETSMVLRAKRGLVTLKGPMTQLQIVEDKPIYLEDTITELYDPKGKVPPIRVKSPKLEGLLKEKKIWTDSPVQLEQADTQDFTATGEGFEGDGGNGLVVLKKNPVVNYLIRNTPDSPPQRHVKLTCLGPLRIEKIPSTDPALQNRRLITAEGNAFLEAEDLADHSKQSVRADQIVARSRSEKDKATPPREPKDSQKDFVRFEKMDARGNVQIDVGDAVVWGDFASTEFDAAGKLSWLEVIGSPRASFTAASANTLTGNQGSSIFVQCDGPLLLTQESSLPGAFRMSFQKRVLLFGSSEPFYLPSHFGSHLELLMQKPEPTEPGQKTSPQLVSAHAEGGVLWRSAQASVSAQNMEIEPGHRKEDPTEITFFPAPLLFADMGSSLIGVSPSSNTPAEANKERKKLVLFTEQKLVQRNDPSGLTSGSTFLEGKVQGSFASATGPAGKILGSDLKLVSQKKGSTQIFSEKGFYYDEGEKGLLVKADRILPANDGGMRLEGNPAELRQPNAEGKILNITAKQIDLNPDSGEFAASQEVVLLAPEDSAPLLGSAQVSHASSSTGSSLRLVCGHLEGKQGQGEFPLEWMKATIAVRIYSKEQEAGAESIHFDFISDLHRLFGSQDNPAWIAGPMQDGRFSARSSRIDIRKRGEIIDFAPNSVMTLSGSAANLGELSKGPNNGNVLVRCKGESHLFKEQIQLQGGVVVGPEKPKPEDAWVLFAQEVRFLRDLKTGEVVSVEAEGDVELASLDLIASGKRLQFFPKNSDLLLFGDEKESASLEIPNRFPMQSEFLKYNLNTGLVSSGAGNSKLFR